MSAEPAGNVRSGGLGTWQTRALAVAILVLLTVVAVAAFQLSQELLDSALFQTFGYAGIFLLTVTCSATLILPAPAFGAVGIAGGVLNPLLVGVAAGLGAATGELTGYIAGRSGRVALGLETSLMTRRIRGWMLRYGFFALLALAAIPNPVFDAAGITAGSLGYPVHRYWLAVALGKTLNYSVIALVGYALATSWP